MKFNENVINVIKVITTGLVNTGFLRYLTKILRQMPSNLLTTVTMFVLTKHEKTIIGSNNLSDIRDVIGDYVV